MGGDFRRSHGAPWLAIRYLRRVLDTSSLADALVDQTEHVVTMARGADLDQQVPTCPDWDLRALLGHIGQGHRFGADTVRRRVTGPDELTAPTSIPVPDEATALADWLVAGARELVDTVVSVGPDQPVWNFSGTGQQAGFWLRRMVHDTAVHRADVARTVDQPYRFDAELAADGISEWLMLVTADGALVARPEVAAQLRGHGQTLHLHATDSSPSLGEAGEWLIRRGSDVVTWEHGHEKADVAVRGSAGDLLLALLGRIPSTDERLDVLGDATLFEHWQRHVTF